MKFTDLAVYTLSVQENKSFRSGDNFIEINEAANTLTIDLDNMDTVHLRFENGKALVKTIIDKQINRKIMNISQVSQYLQEKFNIDLIQIAEGVPYLRKILA